MARRISAVCRWGRIRALGGLALAVIAISAAPVYAEAPTLNSVGYSASGRVTAEWTLGPDSTADSIEVATQPDTQPDGSFVDVNVVEFDVFFDDSAEEWKSEDAVGPGTYFVHLSANTETECEDVVCPEVEEWSNIQRLVIPPPRRGRYVGKTFFGERISLVVSRDGKSIRRLTADYAIDCTRGSGVVRVRFPAIEVEQELEFFDVLKVRVRGGGQLIFTVEGTLTLRGKARGKLDAEGSVKGLGKCRYFGDPEWSARKK